MKNNKKGFTLMEMLIVVAIIAVLVAIAIPVLSGALEKSREAADAANIRSAYAECSVAALTGEKGTCGTTNKTSGTETIEGYTKTVKATQKQTGWQNTQIERIAEKDVKTDVPASTLKGWTVSVFADGTWTVVEEAPATPASGS